jgi:hypothetical protein
VAETFPNHRVLTTAPKMDLFENVPKIGDDQEDGEFVFMPDMDEGGLIDADQFGSDDEEFICNSWDE